MKKPITEPERAQGRERPQEALRQVRAAAMAPRRRGPRPVHPQPPWKPTLVAAGTPGREQSIAAGVASNDRTEVSFLPRSSGTRSRFPARDQGRPNRNSATGAL